MDLVKEWGGMPLKSIAKKLNTDLKNGIDKAEALARSRQYGPNAFERKEADNFLKKVFRQFQNPLVFILTLAGLGALLLGAYVDATVIAIAVAINILIGTIQEERASQAFEKLEKSQTHSATVIREGKRITILSDKLVPGDIVVLESGTYVPADIRLIKTKDLSVNEAALTGEWVPVQKRKGEQKIKVQSLSDRFNMAWMGTLVVAGYGKGIVVNTGNRTQVGRIAKHLQTKETVVTPLQKNIRSIAQFLIYIIGGAIVLVFGFGLFRGEALGEMLLFSIALAVAAMPAGLPAAVTVVLALGMETILKKGGLVRNLMAAETLGSTTTILTDKTGTLTQAKMALSNLTTLSKSSYNIDNLHSDQKTLLEGGVLASDAYIEKESDGEEKITVHGRPIEKAVLLSGLEVGLSQEELKRNYPQLDFLAFESSRRFGVSLNKFSEKNNRLYISGAPETLIANSTHILKNGSSILLTSEIRNKLLKSQEEQSAKGMRLIAVAYRDVDWNTIPVCREDKPGNKEAIKILDGSVTFLGLMTFSDPIREDVSESINMVKRAGVRVIMLTGDNPETARTIASKVNICSENSRVITGSELEDMDDKELLHALKHVFIFARVLPEQKLRIARILKNNGEVVAMTGDGINDAPALRSADIGVAIGSGTEVAKEASDIVLINDSFSIIVSAIRVGRRIIDNLRKIVAHLVSTSFSEIILIGGSLVVGMPLPILPAQILWANIVEEGFLSFAFAFEPEEQGIMKRDPRHSQSRTILTKEIKRLILVISAVTGAFLFALYYYLVSMSNIPIEEIRSIMFVAITLDAIFFAFSLKSLTKPVWEISLFNNKYFMGALALSVLLLLAALTWPPLQFLLSIVPLSGTAITLLIAVGVFNLISIEVAKRICFDKLWTS